MIAHVKWFVTGNSAMNTDINVLVVLDRPQDVVNIGASVRAIKNMGFSRLRLVEPREYAAADLLRIAHHAEDVIEGIEVFASLDAALADAVYVVGTSAIAYGDRPLRRDVDVLGRELSSRAQTGVVALLFGTEADGLDRHALDRCHCIATLPTNPAYPALNLSQSVLLFLYEIARSRERTSPPDHSVWPENTAPQPSMQRDLEQLFRLEEEALSAIGFFRYNPEAAMRTLRQIAYRAELQPQELSLLLAIARQVIYTAKHRESKPVK
jgi:TrmH family RNA methyltransferase